MSCALHRHPRVSIRLCIRDLTTSAETRATVRATMGRSSFIFPITEETDVVTALGDVRAHNETPLERVGSYTFEEFERLNRGRARHFAALSASHGGLLSMALNGATAPGDIAKWTRGGEVTPGGYVRAGDGTLWLEFQNSSFGADTVRFLTARDARWLCLDDANQERFSMSNVSLCDTCTGMDDHLIAAIGRRLLFR